MRTWKKIAIYLMTLLFCVVMMAIPSFAATTSQDGLEVTLTTDKESYNQGEQLVVTLTVKNTNDIAVSNVSMENLIPDGYKVVDGSETTKQLESLGAGETVEQIVTYISNYENSEKTDSGNEDNIGSSDNTGNNVNNGTGGNGGTDTSNSSENNNSSNQNSNKANVGKTDATATGDNTNIMLWVILLGLASVGIISLLLWKKKKVKKALSLFLVTTMALSTVANGFTVEASELQTKSITIVQNVIVENKDIQLSALVEYSIDQDSNIMIGFNEENLIYESEKNVYFFKDSSVQSIDGYINGDITLIDSMEYTICDDHNLMLKNGIIDVNATWSIPDPALVVGSNVVSVKANLVDGNIIESKITIWNASADYTYNVEVDNNDNDNDGVINYLEDYYGTDKNNADSDSDGLSDYTEMYILETDPLKTDTDDDGILDANEDNDNDGIDNITELSLGTDPATSDTDGDDLNDNEECNTYLTNATVKDTDNDGASDGWEVHNNFDPLVYNDTFSITQSQQDEGMSVSVELEVSGQQTETLSISKVEDDTFLNETLPGYIGAAYDFSLGDGEFSSATISFTFDESLLGTENFAPKIYYFNEESQLLEELETTIIGNTASTQVDHFSTYILLNKMEFDKVWETEIKPPNAEVQDATLDIAFVIDYSSSMSDNDPNQIFKQLCKEFTARLRDDKDRAAVVQFIRTATLLSPLTTDKESLNAAIDSIVYDDGYGPNSGTDGSAGLQLALEQLVDSNSTYKYVVFVTDGIDNGYSYSYADLVSSAKASNTVVYTIGMGSASEEILRYVAEHTGGKYYHATTVSDVDEILELDEVFDDIESETIDYTTDSNNDGISDYYTTLLCNGTLRTGTGIPLFAGIDYESVQANNDFDGDGVINGDEIFITEVNGKIYAKVLSSPILSDTDMDGYGDGDDSSPREWNVGDRDLAIFAGLAYEDASNMIHKMYQKEDIKGTEDEPDESYYFLSGASLGSIDEGIAKKWKIVDYVNTWEDIDTYFSATTFRNGNNIVISYRGTNEAIGEWVNNIVGVGLLNYHSEEAAAKNYALKIADIYPRCNIYITGHSLGGYLAQIGAAEVLSTRSINLEKVAYFNGIGLKYNKLLFWSKNEAMDVLAEYANSHPLISYEIKGDVVSALGTHSGERISFYACDEARKHHAGQYGTASWIDFLSKSATGWLSVIAGDNFVKYYEYYGVQSVMEYFWITHETDSFYYNLSQGNRG